VVLPDVLHVSAGAVPVAFGWAVPGRSLAGRPVRVRRAAVPADLTVCCHGYILSPERHRVTRCLHSVTECLALRAVLPSSRTSSANIRPNSNWAEVAAQPRSRQRSKPELQRLVAWSDTQPETCPCRGDIGERFKSPLRHGPMAHIVTEGIRPSGPGSVGAVSGRDHCRGWQAALDNVP